MQTPEQLDEAIRLARIDAVDALGDLPVAVLLEAQLQIIREALFTRARLPEYWRQVEQRIREISR